MDSTAYLYYVIIVIFNCIFFEKFTLVSSLLTYDFNEYDLSIFRLLRVSDIHDKV